MTRIFVRLPRLESPLFGRPMEDHRIGDGSGLPGPYGVIMPGLDRWKEHSAPATDIERMDMKFGDKTVVEACLGVGISRKIIEVSVFDSVRCLPAVTYFVPGIAAS